MNDQNLGVSVTDVADATQETSQQTATENSKETHDDNSVITVVRDPQHSLGKKFILNPDGKISKQSAVAVAIGFAVMYLVNTIKGSCRSAEEGWRRSECRCHQRILPRH
jgi:hypothetical protein